MSASARQPGRPPNRGSRPAGARGSVIAETAVTASLFLLLLLAIVEFARYMLTYNAASEATRIAARMYAGGCSTSAIYEKVTVWAQAGGYAVPTTGASWLTFSPATTCNTEVCRVSITQPPQGTCGTGLLVGRLMLPGIPGLDCLPIPAFTQTATRESGAICN